MLWAPVFSSISVRDAEGRYPRAILKICTGDRKLAVRLKTKIENHLAGQLHLKIHTDRGRVVAEGEAAYQLATLLDWPEPVRTALLALSRYRGIPGVPRTDGDVASRADAARRVVATVARAKKAAFSP